MPDNPTKPPIGGPKKGKLWRWFTELLKRKNDTNKQKN